jgi:DNA-binding XRE family transcriptional regulator
MKPFNSKTQAVVRLLIVEFNTHFKMQYSEISINNAIGSNIKYSRLMRNYSQDYLARMLNISQNAYSKIELGYTRVTVDRLYLISKVLEVNIFDLIALPVNADAELAF